MSIGYSSYRAWLAQATVWLDNDPASDSNDSSLQQLLQTIKRLEQGGMREKHLRISIIIDLCTYVQQDQRTESAGDEHSGDGEGASVSRTAANKTVKCAFYG
ncbi:protein of unknown function [Methanoculleus bourgensis]|uniref:Uncharacterized protein n=1 Tax=Methanoculleus bourgensis TaxID=83986 RepID=A0A0X3BKP8_9EURY|nr:protein of unknown function [Methanoculleus bourgensis]